MGTPLQESIHVGIENGRDIERYKLGKDQAADHAETKRTAGIGVGAKADGDGQGTDDRAGAGHHDRTETNHAEPW